MTTLTALPFLDENGQEINLSHLHQSGMEENMRWVRRLALAPQALVKRYVEAVISHPEDQGLNNLHQLVYKSRFPAQDPVMEGLIQIASPRSAEFLLELLAQPGLVRRKKILNALMHMPLRDEHPNLLAMAEEDEIDLSVYALQVLLKLENVQSLERIRARLSAPWPGTRLAALQVLIRFEGYETLKQILAGASSQDEKTLQILPALIQETEDDSITEVFLPFLDEIPADLRLNVLKKLRPRFKAQQTPLLQQRLHSLNPSREVRLILDILQDLETQWDAVEPLRDLLLEHSCFEVRNTALRLLSQNSDERAVETVFHFLKHNGDLPDPSLGEPISSSLQQRLMDESERWLYSNQPLHLVLSLIHLKAKTDHQERLEELQNSRYTRIRSLAENHLRDLKRQASNQMEEEIRSSLHHSDPIRAASLAEELVSLHPKRLDILKLAAQTFSQVAQPERARECLQNALKIHPREPQSLRLMGELEIKALHPRGACLYFEKALEIEPDNLDLRLQWIQLKLDLQDFAAVMEASRALLSSHPANVADAYIKSAYRLGLLEPIQRDFPRLREHLGLFGKTYAALCFLRLEDQNKAEMLIEELKNSFQPEENALKAFKALSDATGRPDLEEFFLKGKLEFQPASITARTELAKFYLEHDCKQVIALLSDPDLEDTGLLLLKAKAHRKNLEMETAFSQLEDLFLADPRNPEICVEMARIRLEKHQYAKAWASIQHLRDECLLPLGTHYEMMRCQLGLRNRDAAMLYLARALEEKPVYTKAWVQFVEMARKQMLSEELLPYLEKAPEVLKDDCAGLEQLYLLCETQDPDLAYAYAERLLEIQPEDESIRLSLALLYLKNHRHAKACRHFERLTNTLHPRHLLSWAKACEASGNYAKTLSLMLGLLHIPDYRPILEERILLLIRRRDAFQTMARLIRMTDLMPYREVLSELVLLPYKLGTVAYSRNQLDEAQSAFQLCWDLNPDLHRSAFYLGLIQMQAQNQSKAAYWFNQALQHQDPQPIQVRCLLGDVLSRCNEFEASKEQWVHVFRSSPKRSQEALENLFSLQMQMQSPKAFLDFFEEAEPLKSHPQNRLLAARAAYECRRFRETFEHLAKIPEHATCSMARLHLSAKAAVQLALPQALDDLQVLSQEKEAPEDTYLLMTQSYMQQQRMHEALVALKKYSLVQPADRQIQILEMKIRVSLKQSMEFSQCLPRIQVTDLKPEDGSYLAAGLGMLLEADPQQLPFAWLLKNWETLLKRCWAERVTFLALLTFCQDKDTATALMHTLLSDEPNASESVMQLPLSSTLKIQILQTLIQIQPDHGILHFQLSFLYASEEQNEKALKHATECLRTRGWAQQPPVFVRDLFLRVSQTAYRMKNLPLARELLEINVELLPEDEASLRRLGFLLGLSGEHSKRHAIDQRLHRINPSRLDVSSRLYHDARQSGDLHVAIQHLSRLSANKPNESRLLKELAELCIQNGMHMKALQALEKLQELSGDPKCEIALRKGHLWLEMKRELKALECFEQYLSQNPGNHALRFKVASICSEAGYLNRSIVILREVLREDRQNAAVFYELGCLHLTKGEAKVAMGLLKDCLRIKPMHENARLALAKACYQAEETTEALQHADRILHQNPALEEARDLRARIYRDEGLYQEALKDMARLQQTQPNPERMVEMAVLNLKTHQKQTAMRQLREVLGRSQTPPRVKRMVKNLMQKAKTA